LENQSKVIELLVRAYPEALRIRERFNRMLPIHIVASTSAACASQLTMGECQILDLLIDQWPESVREQDDHGETPVEIAMRKANFFEDHADAETTTKMNGQQGQARIIPGPIVHPLLRYESLHPISSCSSSGSGESRGVFHDTDNKDKSEPVGGDKASPEKARTAHLTSRLDYVVSESLYFDAISESASLNEIEKIPMSPTLVPILDSGNEAMEDVSAVELAAMIDSAVSDPSYYSDVASDRASLGLDGVDAQLEIDTMFAMLEAEMMEWFEEKVKEMDEILTPNSEDSRAGRKRHIEGESSDAVTTKEHATRERSTQKQFVPISEGDDDAAKIRVADNMSVKFVLDHGAECRVRERVVSPLTRSTHISMKIGLFNLQVGKGKKLMKCFRRPNPFYEVAMESFELGFPLWYVLIPSRSLFEDIIVLLLSFSRSFLDFQGHYLPIVSTVRSS
jgi:hypothetical protein